MALPHAAPQGQRKDYLAALKDLNCYQKIPNPKCKTHSVWQGVFVLKEKLPVSNLLGRWYKQISSTEQHPMDYNTKYNFNQIWLLWLQGDSVPRCWASGCCCWKPWEIPCPTSPLFLPESPYSPCTRLCCALFFLLRGALCVFSFLMLGDSWPPGPPPFFLIFLFA